METRRIAAALLMLYACSAPHEREQSAAPTDEPSVPEAAATSDLEEARALLASAESAVRERRFDEARADLDVAFELALALPGAAEREDVAGFAWDVGKAASSGVHPPLAKRAFEHVLAQRERTLPAGDVRVVDARVALATALRHTGDLQGARALGEQALIDYERLLDDDHPDLMIARMNLATSRRELGDAKGAQELLEAVVATLERTRPEDDVMLWSQRTQLAVVMRLQGRRAESRALLEQTVATLARVQPADGPELATARSALAGSLLEVGEIAAARPLLEQVLATFERTLPPDDMRLQGARANLAAILARLGESELARTQLERVLASWERTLRADDPRLEAVRQNLSTVLIDLGEIEPARALCEEVLATRARRLPPGHGDVLAARTNLGYVLYQLGDLGAARAIQEDVLGAWEQQLGEDDPQLIAARLNLAATSQTIGDLALARSLHERALASAEKTLAREHPHLQTAREGLAITLELQGEHAAALVLYERVMSDLEQLHGPDHLEVQRVRYNLAGAVERNGDLAGARSLLESALTAYADSGHADDLACARVRVNLATVRMKQGELAETRPLLEQAVEELAAVLGEEHPDVLMARSNLVELLAALGDAPALASELERLERGLAASWDRTAGEAPREALGRWAALREPCSALLVHAPRGSALERRAFELLESIRARGVARPLRTDDLPPELAAELAQARAQQRAILALLAGASAAPATLADLVRRRDQAERALRAALPETQRLELARLAAALPENTRAVGFHRYLTALSGSEPVEHVVAFVLAPDQRLERIELGPVEPLEAAVEAWRTALGHPRGAEVLADARGIGRTAPINSANSAAAAGSPELAAGEHLRALVLDPVLKASGGATRLCVCVDELLASIPLDALPRGNERVGDAIALHVESSFARLLEPAAAEPAGNPTLLAMGAAELAAVSTTTLPELPAAGPELEAVVRRFHARWADGQATLTTGSAAQKSAFLAAAPSARFLHVATHGWYAFEGASSVLAAPRGTGAWSPSMEASAIRAFAPLTSCGLAFAGTSGASAPDVLTAEELARLDLRQCDLAVLSACETAAGLALGGQSTQSLQAALHAAGARSAITSLWRVSDASARALFEEFYAGLWERGESRSDALWHAKRALRAQGLPPGEWAGWVLSGASR